MRREHRNHGVRRRRSTNTEASAWIKPALPMPAAHVNRRTALAGRAPVPPPAHQCTMFTSVDVAHMITAKNIHLDSYQSVKIWAVPIYTAVKSGSMPLPGTIGPDGKLEQPWPPEWVNTFGCWIQQGCAE
jgi:hypothetical protein